jgi:fumarate reductase subunit D
MAKSNKPLIWSLFAGGGMLAAFVTPVMILITGIAIPMGLIASDVLAYERVLAFATNPIGKLILFAVVLLPLWHAAHRLRMTLHDLGVGNKSAVVFVCYGGAGIATIAAATILLMGL